jgi:pimeloyl-ACP methyl ester carboxylesterase/GNAT superfamily N-acetyltransferase
MQDRRLAITVPLPVLSGIVFRLFRTEADYEAVASLYSASSTQDHTDSRSLLTRPQTAEEIASLAQWLGRPTEHLLLALVDETVIGYQLIGEWMNEHADWQYLHRGLVHPDWRGRGIGTALVHWAELQLRALAAIHPITGRATLAADAESSPDAQALLLDQGYQEAWRLTELTWMRSMVPVSRLPSGLTIRPAQSADHLPLWQADDEVFGSTGEWERHIPPRFDPSQWFLACAGSEIVGFYCYEIRDHEGIVPILGVRAPWRRQGIGHALLTHALQTCVERGVTQVHTIGNATNDFPTQRLYASLGFHAKRDHTWYEKLLETPPCRFDWPHGKRIDIGGRRLHLWHGGTGRPTVIFDSGGECDSLVWRHVLPQVTAFAQVVAYDRAGLRQSEPGPLPRTARAVVDDLSALLATANIPGPYVLVGHSMGGIYARLFASLYPQDIVGLVLVDSPHEDMVYEWQTLLPKETWENFVLHSSYESGDYLITRAQLKVAPPLPDVPLIVLTARQGDYPYGWPRDALNVLRVRLQRQLVTLVSRGRQIIVEDTGHAIHEDRPEIVVDAIREVLNSV